MRRILKLSKGKLFVLLLLTVLIGLVISWSTSGGDDSFPALAQMADVAQNELGLRPQFVGHLNLDLWRTQTKKYRSWGVQLLPAIYKHVGLAIPYHPTCSLREIATKSQSLVVLGFSGMRTLYVTLLGDFVAEDYLKCAGKKMKQQVIGGRKVWIGDETYWWQGEEGALVGMGVNPRPPLFSFGLKYNLNLFGKSGVLHHILNEKNAMFRGLYLAQSNVAGMFALSGLEDMNLPQGITIQFHRMEGEVTVGKHLNSEMKVYMRKRQHALRFMGLYHLTTSLAPKPIRTLLKPLKAQRAGRFVEMTYKLPFARFVGNIQTMLVNTGMVPKKRSK